MNGGFLSFSKFFCVMNLNVKLTQVVYQIKVGVRGGVIHCVNPPWRCSLVLVNVRNGARFCLNANR
jgi:hypothetical protein